MKDIKENKNISFHQQEDQNSVKNDEEQKDISEDK